MAETNYTFAEAIAKYLKNQDVEIYCGDNGETQQFSETESTQKSIIRGKVEDALGDCLVISVTRYGFTTTVYLNGFGIKTIVPIKDPLFMKDIYLDEEEFKKKGKKGE